jgi:hypothetical protein
LKRGFSKNEALLSSKVYKFGDDSFEDLVLEEFFFVSLSYESKEISDK